ncbi:MAG: hypothetical protein M1828_000291 [Chrysothrix sp. TS-e1954]|nr:MAG: hypothetical protein M1828_000291 [Chrysothrix sp. TS-e1954]
MPSDTSQASDDEDGGEFNSSYFGSRPPSTDARPDYIQSHFDGIEEQCEESAQLQNASEILTTAPAASTTPREQSTLASPDLVGEHSARSYPGTVELQPDLIVPSKTPAPSYSTGQTWAPNGLPLRPRASTDVDHPLRSNASTISGLPLRPKASAISNESYDKLSQPSKELAPWSSLMALMQSKRRAYLSRGTTADHESLLLLEKIALDLLSRVNRMQKLLMQEDHMEAHTDQQNTNPSSSGRKSGA